MSDQIVRLSRASEIVERITGERPSRSKMYRWAQEGVDGVKLPVVFIGGVRGTSESRIREFFDRITEAKLTPKQPCKTKQRIDRAERELEKIGA